MLAHSRGDYIIGDATAADQRLFRAARARCCSADLLHVRPWVTPRRMKEQRSNGNLVVAWQSDGIGDPRCQMNGER